MAGGEVELIFGEQGENLLMDGQGLECVCSEKQKQKNSTHTHTAESNTQERNGSSRHLWF